MIEQQIKEKQLLADIRQVCDQIDPLFMDRYNITAMMHFKTHIATAIIKITKSHKSSFRRKLGQCVLLHNDQIWHSSYLKHTTNQQNIVICNETTISTDNMLSQIVLVEEKVSWHLIQNKHFKVDITFDLNCIQCDLHHIQQIVKLGKLITGSLKVTNFKQSLQFEGAVFGSLNIPEPLTDHRIQLILDPQCFSRYTISDNFTYKQFVEYLEYGYQVSSNSRYQSYEESFFRLWLAQQDDIELHFGGLCALNDEFMKSIFPFPYKNKKTKKFKLLIDQHNIAQYNNKQDIPQDTLLRMNNISSTGLVYIVQGLTSYLNLQSLTLSFNKLPFDATSLQILLLAVRDKFTLKDFKISLEYMNVSYGQIFYWINNHKIKTSPKLEKVQFKFNMVVFDQKYISSFFNYVRSLGVKSLTYAEFTFRGCFGDSLNIETQVEKICPLNVKYLKFKYGWLLYDQNYSLFPWTRMDDNGNWKIQNDGLVQMGHKKHAPSQSILEFLNQTFPRLSQIEFSLTLPVWHLTNKVIDEDLEILDEYEDKETLFIQQFIHRKMLYVTQVDVNIWIDNNDNFYNKYYTYIKNSVNLFNLQKIRPLIFKHIEGMRNLHI